jgi:acetyltransferase EpsM
VSNLRYHFVRRVMDTRAGPFGSVFAPSADLADNAGFMPGCVINRLVAVGGGAQVGFCSILNRGATVGHDCTLGAFVTVGPGANLAGGVEVGDHATVGMGANVLEGRKVGRWATVGAGAVVTKDVPDGETWLGVPARKVR